MKMVLGKQDLVRYSTLLFFCKKMCNSGAILLTARKLKHQRLHGVIIHGGSGGKIGGRGVGGDNSYNRGIHTSVNHGSCHHPTAAMGPHSQILSIQ
jgi:hypothetical protein